MTKNVIVFLWGAFFGLSYGLHLGIDSGQKTEHKSQQSEKEPTVIHYYDDGCFVDDGKNEYQLKRLTTKDIEDHIK